MADAYKCEGCGEFREGKPIHARFGRNLGTMSYKYQYEWVSDPEVCQSCYDDLKDAVQAVMDGDA